MSDRIVFYVCILSASFIVGYWAGYERSAVELMPCPKEAGFSVVSRTATTCNYISASKTYGKAQKVRQL